MAAKKAKAKPESNPKRLARGFVKTGGILSKQISRASEKRGFSESRLLTHWAEFAGESIASIARPVKVSYGRQGFGATLTILANGANAPILQASIPKLKERVNACYGYSAISHIRITQTASTGFGEEAAIYQAAPAEKTPISPENAKHLDAQISPIKNEGLRMALAALGENILTRRKTETSKG